MKKQGATEKCKWYLVQIQRESKGVFCNQNLAEHRFQLWNSEFIKNFSIFSKVKGISSIFCTPARLS